MTPNAQISVWFQPKGHEQSQIQLADLDYKPQEGGSPAMVVKDTEQVSVLTIDTNPPLAFMRCEMDTPAGPGRKKDEG